MRGSDAARTWATIYLSLKDSFPEPRWTWDAKQLEDITTELTLAIIGASK